MSAMPRVEAAVCAVSLLAALGVLAVRTTPLDLDPGSRAWPRLVAGASGGRVAARATLILSGFDRSRPRTLVVAAEPAASLLVGVDGGRLLPLRAAPGGSALALPVSAMPGLRLDVQRFEGEPPPELARLAADAPPFPLAACLIGALLAGAAVLTGGIARDGRFGLIVGLFVAGAFGLLAAPALLWLSLPSGAAAWRLLAVVALPAAGGLLAARESPARRPELAHAAALASLLLLGGFVRLYFLFSTGSWDTEYWKAWMFRAASAGVTRAYGDADAVPPGQFLAQLQGAPRYEVPFRGRSHYVDYPPLAMALWKGSWRFAEAVAPGLDPLEKENAAVRLPALLGDLLTLPILYLALRSSPRRAAWIAALYWAMPVSWLSSGPLAYFDGAVTPPTLLALIAAGRGRAARAGAWLAVACLVKPTALLVAPAVAMGLLARRAPLARAAATGLAVTALVFLPYALAGTLETAVVHMYRIFQQERLSGGFPNPWWVLGHVLAGGAGPVPFAPISLLPIPARPVGSLLFLAFAALVAWRQRWRAGLTPACLAGAALFFGYGMLGIGVHENHLHPLLPLLCATGLATAGVRLFAVLAGGVYVLNMLLLSGLGRFHGLRYAALEPLGQSIVGWRMALGFDATLLLAAVNAALFLWLILRLDRAMAQAAPEQPESERGEAIRPRGEAPAPPPDQ